MIEHSVEQYFVKVGADGKKRFFLRAATVKEGKIRQATKTDIKLILEDVNTKRKAYDEALMEYVND